MRSGSGEQAQIMFRPKNYHNSYYYILKGRGYNDVLLYKRENGSASSLYEYDLPSSFASYLIDTGFTYHISIVCTGPRIDFYLDGYFLFSYNDFFYNNKTFGTGKVGFSTYCTDALFNNLTVTTTAAGQAIQHTFASGTNNIDLTVTDTAGQSTTGTIPMTMHPGAVPVADAGGPYVVYESSGNAFEGGWTVTLDGSGSSDPETSIIKYVQDLGTDTFEGTTINDAKWTYSNSEVTQNEAIVITGNNNWGQCHLFSKDTYDRAKGMAFEARIMHTGGYAMVGFKNTNTTYHYNQMTYAIYFYTGYIYIFEDGENRGVNRLRLLLQHLV